LARGDKAQIVTIEPRQGNHLRKLAAFGLLPGVQVEVLQTFPVFVLQIDYTQLALDEEMASSIIVQK
jgi:Fe2+ transport system protein FeoA